ncbi:fibronectin type 3 and ankyrin repeat domains protein 1 isoform X2 [Penaeus vannamei]|uniref:fibronectin type 3 and ankyrin repeat domains protein 1 isoform X2 n=1 Tax=Penaeus vannamei TaxID=6689 RepID=UPI00387F85C8
MEGPTVRASGLSHHWVRVEWGDPNLQETSFHDDPRAQADSAPTSTVDPASPRDAAVEEVNDSYEYFLELAYAKEVEADAYLQDEDGLEDGPLEEEIDRTEVFTEEPSIIYTAQCLFPRTGWSNVYRGSGVSCVVEGLCPGQEVTVRVRASEEGSVSPWSTITLKTKNVPGSGHDLVEAVRENSATLVREALAELTKFSQLERMDHVVEEGHTALVAAVMAGSRDGLAVLLERRAGVAAPTPGPHLTPLMLAAWLGHAELARRLRAAGASWNTVDRSGMTALHYGVAGRQLELVTAALQDGASPTMPAGPHSVLTLVVIASYAAAPSPRRTGAAGTQLVTEQCSRMMEFLVRAGAQVNQRGAGGNAALHVALTLGQARLARKLVELGADSQLVNGRGYSPSHLAKLSGHSLDTSTPRDEDRPPMGELEALTHLMDDISST